MVANPGQALPPLGASSWSPVPSPTGCRQDWVPVPIAGTGCCPTAFIPWVWARWVLPERAVPPLPPQPSALALSPQESRNPSRPRSGPPLKTSGISTAHTRRAAGGMATPTAASGAWPGPLGAACSPWCVPSPFRGWKTGGSPYPALHPRTGQLRNRVCCDSLRGSLPRGPSAHSERASQASRGHLGGFGGNRCPAAWLRFLGLREAQSCAPCPPTDRGLGWAGLQVA